MASYVSEVLADSPVAYYRLGEVSGTTMNDLSGNARHGTYDVAAILGATGAIGDGDRAVTVVGTATSSAVVPNGTWMNGGAAGTTKSIECWFRYSGTPGEQQVFGRSTGASTCIYGIHVNGGNVGGRARTNVTTVLNTTTGGYNSGTWHHAVLTIDVALAAGTECKLYTDGVLAVTGGVGGFTLATNADTLIVGGRGGVGFFAGDVDECAVYDQVLSAARVLAHYNAASVMTYPVKQLSTGSPLKISSGGSWIPVRALSL